MSPSAAVAVVLLFLGARASLAEYALSAPSSYHSVPSGRDVLAARLATVGQRIDDLRGSLPSAMDAAADSISRANADSNLKQLSYGAGVFAGTALSIASALDAEPDWDNLPNSFIFTQTSTALNGWSFGAIWVTEGQLEDPVVTCGGKDFDATMAAFGLFEAQERNAAEQNLLSLDASTNPFHFIQEHELTEHLRIELSRLEKDLGVALECVVSQAGGNAEAQVAAHMLGAFLEAQGARLDVMEELREAVFEEHLLTLA